MKENYAYLLGNPLFDGLTAPDIGGVWPCLSPDVRMYAKGESLILAGGRIPGVGVVLEGQVSVARESEDGRRTLIASISPPGLFAEALVCAGLDRSPVTVTAQTDARVAFLAVGRILYHCPKDCEYHALLGRNLLREIARKSLLLRAQVDLLTLRTLRDKVLAYLRARSAEKQARQFDIPLDRGELAEYLGVDRSALSRELSNMRRDGLIDFWKNSFKLVK